MSDQTPPVAPSATPDPAPLSAVDQAVAAGDVSAYRAARDAERAGTPLPPVADTPAAPAAAAPDDQAASTDATDKAASEPADPPKTRERINQLLADRARERDRAERLERELAEIRRQSGPTAPPTRPAAPSAAPGSDDPEPRLEDFEADPEQYPDPYTAHLKAQARWEARQEFRQFQAAERAKAEQAERVKAVDTRNAAFRERLTREDATDPAWRDAISDEVKALRPFDALQPGEQPTGYHAIAEEIVSSEKAVQFMRHFSAHPEELKRIAGLPPRLLLWQMGKLDAQFDAPTAPAKTPPKTVTTAPPPPPTVGTRVTEGRDELAEAVASHDFGSFKAARIRQMTANLR